MGGLVKGDVVVVPFPFSDLSRAKRRPALVLASFSPGDVILCQITSQSARDEYVIPLSSSDFVDGGLPKESHVRPNKLFTAHEGLVLYSPGRLERAKMDDVTRTLVSLLSSP